MTAAHPASGRRRSPLWLAVGAAAIGGGVVGGAIVAGTDHGTSATAVAAGTGCGATSVASRALPSVVTISASGAGGSGTGSGEVIRSDGYILTNNHVISMAANGGSVQVLYSDGLTADAAITGRDPQTDLAVLKVKASSHLSAIRLGSSTSVQVGEPVVALGAPLGLSGTVTSGIVSAVDRTVQVPGDDDQLALLVSAVQTDAAINPGNSGGALVNCSAELIGVPSAGASVPSSSGESNGGNIGLGFAIPVDLAKTISDELISTGKVSHAYLGLQTVPVPPAAAKQAGLPEGLYVKAVQAGGPSSRAGLREGDVITSVEGKAAKSNDQLAILTLTKKAGHKVAIGYVRSGHSAHGTITLGVQP